MIRFEKATVSYPGPGKPALNQVSIDVDKGEFVFLVGTSGSGKSTALRLVLRELRPTGGPRLRRRQGDQPPRHLEGAAAAPPDRHRVPGLPAAADQDRRRERRLRAQVTGRSGREIKTTVPETLEMVGLADKAGRMPDELSGGEQQRVAIARAMVNKPMILIADEPTGNLDPATSVGIMKLLETINGTGTTVLMATHDHGIVDQMRKRVIELDHGRVVRDEAAGAYGFQH